MLIIKEFFAAIASHFFEVGAVITSIIAISSPIDKIFFIIIALVEKIY